MQIKLSWSGTMYNLQVLDYQHSFKKKTKWGKKKKKLKVFQLKLLKLDYSNIS